MQCPNPKCKSRRIGVVKTIPLIQTRLRMRICFDCHTIFDTEERIIPDSEKIVQETLFGPVKPKLPDSKIRRKPSLR